MGFLIDTIRKEYPGHTLYFDAGDQFQVGIESSPLISQGKIMSDFYDALSVDASAIGNHEFDFGPDFLMPYLQNKESPNLAANLRSENNRDNFLPEQKSSQMFELSSGIRVGVIGLSTIETPSTTNAFKEKLFPQYKFEAYKDVVVTEAAKLRKAGANAVLLSAHVGNGCFTSNQYGIWKESTKQEDCGVDDEATMLIDALPKGTIDGFLQGHRHKFAHHFHKGT